MLVSPSREPEASKSRPDHPADSIPDGEIGRGKRTRGRAKHRAPALFARYSSRDMAERRGTTRAKQVQQPCPGTAVASNVRGPKGAKLPPIDFLQPNINQIRHSVRDIDDSYNHTWDVLAELCQNAVDAIRQTSVQQGLIRLEIDANEKSILVSD